MNRSLIEILFCIWLILSIPSVAGLENSRKFKELPTSIRLKYFLIRTIFAPIYVFLQLVTLFVIIIKYIIKFIIFCWKLFLFFIQDIYDRCKIIYGKIIS